MNIIFEINHPAHIHLFRCTVSELEKKGISSDLLIKSEPDIEYLAGYYGLSYTKMGTRGKGLWQKYLYQLIFLFKSVRIARKQKAILGLGVSMNLPMVSKFSAMQSICLDDDDMEVTPVFAKYANKASVILTPSALAHEKRGEHQITYPGYHELAYLHPNRFKPDPSVLKLLNVKQGEKYFVLRFNAFNAHHDIGEGGMNYDQKVLLVEKLSIRGRVFISTESKVEPEFQHLLLPDRPELIHSFLAFATLYVGESQTMTSEAAVLGTPALKCNTFAGRLSIPNELEQKYGLCYAYLPLNFNKMLEKIDELLYMSDLKKEWQKRKARMLQDKIDVTAFLVWFVENYPQSTKTLKYEPEDN